MPRARTGTLVRPNTDGLWRGRVTQTAKDGETKRPLYSLGTTDKAMARRKLARFVAAVGRGDELLDAAVDATAPERVEDNARAWITKRETQGIGMAKKELRTFERYVFGDIGHLPMGDVRPSHIRSVLDEAAATGLRRATLSEIRGVMFRLFRAAVEVELIEVNPAAAVRTPKTREVRKERVILTDSEFTRFVACPAVDLELCMLALVARCEGGMRTGDLHKWRWNMLDRVHFAECIIPRAKKRTPQRLAIPDALAPFLRAWWDRAGKPETGPVFPVRIGPRAGEAKRPLNSYAKRLRRDLFRAGIHREPPIEVPATMRGQRTDLGHAAEGTQLAPNPCDPLYYETESTLPVDFHSFRRAFASGLAEAGVNVQLAMNLTNHSDPRVHARYVMDTAAMRTTPDAALPRLPAAALAKVRAPDDSPSAEAPERPGIVTARDVFPPKGEGGVDGGGRNYATSRRILRSGCRTRTCDPAVNSPSRSIAGSWDPGKAASS